MLQKKNTHNHKTNLNKIRNKTKYTNTHKNKTQHTQKPTTTNTINLNTTKNKP